MTTNTNAINNNIIIKENGLDIINEAVASEREAIQRGLVELARENDLKALENANLSQALAKNFNILECLSTAYSKALDDMSRLIFNGVLDKVGFHFQDNISKSEAGNKGYFMSQIYESETLGRKLSSVTLSLDYATFNQPEKVLETLLHELIHHYADMMGIKDTSRQGRYHNKNFEALCRRFGLGFKKDDKIGVITGGVSNSIAKIFAKIIKDRHLEEIGLEIRKLNDGKTEAKAERKEQKVFTYQCNCGNSIRGKFGLNIICCDCNTKYTIKAKQ